MRRKIAVFADCSANELIPELMKGIEEVAKQNDIDVFYFISFALWENTEVDNMGERNIYDLPNLKEFDGVILITFSLNSDISCKKLRDWVIKEGVNAVTLDYDLEGIPGIMTDNECGMYELTKHLVTEHNVRKVVHLCGFDGEESRQRLAGVQRALGEVGEHVEESDIIHCSWSFFKAIEKVLEYIDSGKPLPDAFIAASDFMAIGVCTALEQRGYRVPDDVIVTGYDNVESSSIYLPALSTVDRRTKELGKAGMRKLIKLMDGKEVPFREVVKSSFRPAESCGCKLSRQYNKIRNESCKNTFVQTQMKADFERRIWRLNRGVRHVNTVNEFMDYMKSIIANSVEITSEKQVFCLYDAFFDFISGEQSESNQISCIYVDKYSKEPVVKKVDRGTLLPFDTNNSNHPHSYLFTAIHDRNDSYGYAVYIDAVDLIFNTKLISWEGTINQILGRAHESLKVELMNKKVREAAYIDAVSGLNNRKAFNDKAVKMMMDNGAQGISSALILIDIDRMKLINDRYGHLKGDDAIATVGEAINSVLPEGWIGIRYGGDEFIMAGVCDSEADMLELELTLQDTVSSIVISRDIAYPLTISTGGVIFTPDEDMDIEDCIKLADDTMYKMKENKREQRRIWGDKE
ncbi:MAG: GGDEF domain-containing protein [Lachnospiraceae bacterium]|nr:GGDEF domain-containing protein [Lachnospiraceae bacterium]